jgi:hypothetical protein
VSLVANGAVTNTRVQQLLDGNGEFLLVPPPWNQHIGWGPTGPTAVYPPALTPGVPVAGSVRTEISADGYGLDESKSFYKFTLSATKNVTVSMQIAGTGTVSTSTYLRLFVKDVDTANALSDPQANNEVPLRTAGGSLGSGTYVIYVDGAEKNSTGAFNFTNNQVTFNLTVTTN